MRSVNSERFGLFVVIVLGDPLHFARNEAQWLAAGEAVSGISIEPRTALHSSDRWLLYLSIVLAFGAVSAVKLLYFDVDALHISHHALTVRYKGLAWYDAGSNTNSCTNCLYRAYLHPALLIGVAILGSGMQMASFLLQRCCFLCLTVCCEQICSTQQGAQFEQPIRARWYLVSLAFSVVVLLLIAVCCCQCGGFASVLFTLTVFRLLHSRPYHKLPRAHPIRRMLTAAFVSHMVLQEIAVLVVVLLPIIARSISDLQLLGKYDGDRVCQDFE